MKKLFKSKEVTSKPVASQFKLKTGLKAGNDCTDKASELLRAGDWYGAAQQLKNCG